MEDLKRLIRDVPDFPQKGVIFRDITPLLGNAEAFANTVDRMVDYCRERYGDGGIDKVVCIESRGFIFGSALAYKLGAGLAIVRKPGKLPYKTISADYQLEYGTNTLAIHEDAISRGERIVIIDDVLATGGTAKATVELVERLGGRVSGILFLIELGFLNGREKIKDYDCFSMIKY
ncbi:MAG: adenine phosphoribosyltransferase [bacterium]